MVLLTSLLTAATATAIWAALNSGGKTGAAAVQEPIVKKLPSAGRAAGPEDFRDSGVEQMEAISLPSGISLMGFGKKGVEMINVEGGCGILRTREAGRDPDGHSITLEILEDIGTPVTIPELDREHPFLVAGDVVRLTGGGQPRIELLSSDKTAVTFTAWVDAITPLGSGDSPLSRQVVVLKDLEGDTGGVRELTLHVSGAAGTFGPEQDRAVGHKFLFALEGPLVSPYQRPVASRQVRKIE